MRNVEFIDKETKNLYKILINEHQGLASVINSLLQKDNVKIQDIINDNYIVQVITSFGKELININIDLLKNKIYVVSSCKPHKEIYDNFPKKDIKPIGYEYQNGNRIVIQRNIFSYDSSNKKTYYYDIIDNDNSYNLLIEDKNSSFNSDDFIRRILYNSMNYSSIRNLFVTILNELNSNLLSIKITDDLGSVIVIDKGIVTKYLEIYETNNEYQKIYLENEEFYVERKIKEVYEDNLTSYIKRIGENNGKEKR